ncbi:MULTISPECIES: hypothetical protein [unclassified Dyella]|jgi:hypothetical protein|uniref:hypothetical protein n=1 Tax=unclassified Dyella TaxID=2634549 RepID=UPI003F93E753
MKGWIRKTWMGCVVAVSLGVPVAHADGGTITFSGAVVAPTCAASSESMTAMLPAQQAATSRRRLECGGDGLPGTASHAFPSSYTLTVEPLESSSLSADRLIGYFSGYVKASGHADARMNLVTQAYD